MRDGLYGRRRAVQAPAQAKAQALHPTPARIRGGRWWGWPLHTALAAHLELSMRHPPGRPPCHQRAGNDKTGLRIFVSFAGDGVIAREWDETFADEEGLFADDLQYP